MPARHSGCQWFVCGDSWVAEELAAQPCPCPPGPAFTLTPSVRSCLCTPTPACIRPPPPACIPTMPEFPDCLHLPTHPLHPPVFPACSCPRCLHTWKQALLPACRPQSHRGRGQVGIWHQDVMVVCSLSCSCYGGWAGSGGWRPWDRQAVGGGPWRRLPDSSFITAAGPGHEGKARLDFKLENKPRILQSPASALTLGQAPACLHVPACPLLQMMKLRHRTPL